MNIVILTAKGGNQTLSNKNLVPVCGTPTMVWPLTAAMESKTIDHVFVTTEDTNISSVAHDYGATIIERPDTLAQPDSNHGDVILHAAKQASRLTPDTIDTITILLGNTVMVTSDDIDRAVKTCLNDPSADGAMTVWKAQDDHPLRALTIGDAGYLESYFQDATPDTNRQSYPNVFFYDQGPWTVRMESLLRSEKTKEGPGPWWWMGEKVIPLERLWVTGRDTHSAFDLEIAEWWLEHYRLAGRRNPYSVDENTS
ncbi:hypothetical protein HH1059_04280 [Halorhodospira halochloris]|uniref:N-Acetylneuraminate cytidylyltransferase n=1 Tax=Halorhodospira halochloris TaxID=1052 RepID=A0A110B529_HALHR|nr:NTP transferase domain-containing protein [Halorhodospira halochloris]BAU57098.2 hypothetical protein HH1059_04280 [Halorhodospira halochloris]